MNSSDSRCGDGYALLIDNGGIVLDAHETASNALGWAREELLNKGIGELFEYGGDLVMNSLVEMQDPAKADSHEKLSVSTLVRKKDRSHFPATAIVQSVPELGCFAIAFEDLPGDIAEMAPLIATDADAHSEPRCEAAPEVEHIHAPAETNAAPQEVFPEPRQGTNEILRVSSRDLERPSANLENGAPKFRNIFLSGSRGNGESNGSNGANGKDDMATQLENEKQERKRLEARIVSLNDQLQQLHVQLKNNLESETIYQKRVNEAEEELLKAEESKAAAERAVLEEQQRHNRLEQEFDQFKTTCAQQRRERELRQKEWLSKLQSSLAALQESDARLEKEISARRAIEVKLQLLQQDFFAHAESKEMDAPKISENSMQADSCAQEQLEECEASANRTTALA